MKLSALYWHRITPLHFLLLPLSDFIRVLFNAKEIMLLAGYLAFRQAASTCHYSRQYQYR